MEIVNQTIKRIVRSYFRNDYGKPYELTNGQCDIFSSVFLRQFPRVQIISATQYGKSDVISMALVLRVVTHGENWVILAGTADKAKIIMSRVIQHMFDHIIFYSRLELDPHITLDKLRRERSKEHLTFKGGGSIRVISADSRNKGAVKNTLTGFGSPNIIEDEASLIPDDIQSMVMRMLGGHKDNCLIKVGNPFYNNHFKRSRNSDKYHKVLIDYEQGIREGRYTQEFIDEMRKEMFFEILYECKFPDESEFDEGGWRKLFPHELLERSMIDKSQAGDLLNEEWIALGCDFAGAGRDRNAYVLRSPKVVMLVSTNKISDTMQQVPLIEEYKGSFGLEGYEIAVDYGGLGQGIGDRLIEVGLDVNCVMFGQSSPEPTKYQNMRAWMYYQLWQWLKEGGKIVRDEVFWELENIFFKEDSEHRFKIEPKEDLKKRMKKNGLKPLSPDGADACVLTFAASGAITKQDFDFV